MSKGKSTTRISDLKCGIGWISFTIFQMKQLGIDPNIHTTTDLRQKVFEKLNIVRCEKKEKKVKK